MFSICTLATPANGSEHPTPFPAFPHQRVAVVVPGDEELFVGGDGFNGATGRQLSMEMPTAYTAGVFEKINCPFAPMFREAHANARLTPGLVVLSIPDCPSVSALYSLALDREASFGSVFLATFSGPYPEKSPNNMAMLYCVGPLGQNRKGLHEGEVAAQRERHVHVDPREFLREVSKVGKAIGDLVEFYNSTIEPLGRISVLRLPIVSGGVFIHPDVRPSEVGCALLRSVWPPLLAAGVTLELMPSPAMKEALSIVSSE